MYVSGDNVDKMFYLFVYMILNGKKVVLPTDRSLNLYVIQTGRKAVHQKS